MRTGRLLCLFLLLVAGHVHALDVFVSILPQKQLVEMVGGEQVSVRVLLAPGQSPELWEPSGRELAVLSDADLFFRQGVPFERTLIQALTGARKKPEIIDLREGIVMAGSHVHEHGGAVVDPHIWTSPRLLIRQAETIRDAFINVDPRSETYYRQRYIACRERLERLDSDIRTMLSDQRAGAFLVLHPAWGYFAREYGLEQISIEQHGQEPQARALAQLFDMIHARRLSFMLVPRKHASRHTRAVAAALGVRVVAMDPLAEDVMGHLRELAEKLAGRKV